MSSDLDELAELLYGPAEVVQGTDLSDSELVEFAAKSYPNKPYCIVRQWMIINVMVSAEREQEIKKAGMRPTVIYAENTILDSSCRFPAGHWVRSTYQVSFEKCFFETKNTIYILAGRGFRKFASTKAVLSLSGDAIGLV